MREHSEECLRHFGHWYLYMQEFERTYPGYCRKCGGVGLFQTVENGAPHGAGYWPMPMTELCEDCLEAGKCPRCGAVLDNEDGTSESYEEFLDGYSPCPKCGFVVGDYQQDVALQEPECLCWLREDVEDVGE